METELWERVYESMTCHVSEEHRIPGVEDAFADNGSCVRGCFFTVKKQVLQNFHRKYAKTSCIFPIVLLEYSLALGKKEC